MAVQYLKHKRKILTERDTAADAARTLARQGTSRQEIMCQLVGPNVNRRFVERLV